MAPKNSIINQLEQAVASLLDDQTLANIEEKIAFIISQTKSIHASHVKLQALKLIFGHIAQLQNQDYFRLGYFSSSEYLSRCHEHYLDLINFAIDYLNSAKAQQSMSQVHINQCLVTNIGLKSQLLHYQAESQKKRGKHHEAEQTWQTLYEFYEIQLEYYLQHITMFGIHLPNFNLINSLSEVIMLRYNFILFRKEHKKTAEQDAEDLLINVLGGSLETPHQKIENNTYSNHKQNVRYNIARNMIAIHSLYFVGQQAKIRDKKQKAAIYYNRLQTLLYSKREHYLDHYAEYTKLNSEFNLIANIFIAHYDYCALLMPVNINEALNEIKLLGTKINKLLLPFEAKATVTLKKLRALLTDARVKFNKHSETIEVLLLDISSQYEEAIASRKNIQETKSTPLTDEISADVFSEKKIIATKETRSRDKRLNQVDELMALGRQAQTKGKTIVAFRHYHNLWEALVRDGIPNHVNYSTFPFQTVVEALFDLGHLACQKGNQELIDSITALTDEATSRCQDELTQQPLHQANFDFALRIKLIRQGKLLFDKVRENHLKKTQAIAIAKKEAKLEKQLATIENKQLQLQASPTKTKKKKRSNPKKPKPKLSTQPSATPSSVKPVAPTVEQQKPKPIEAAPDQLSLIQLSQLENAQQLLSTALDSEQTCAITNKDFHQIWSELTAIRYFLAYKASPEIREQYQPEVTSLLKEALLRIQKEYGFPLTVLEVLAKLSRENTQAYLYGGAIRQKLKHCKDSHPEKDYDIATNVPLAEVRQLFPDAESRNSRIPLVILKYQQYQIEIRSLRATKLKKDAQQLDVSVNAIYYSLNHGLHDPLKGREALNENKLILCNGLDSFCSDGLLLLRLIYLENKCGLQSHKKTNQAKAAFLALAELDHQMHPLQTSDYAITAPRRFHAIRKLIHNGMARKNLDSLRRAKYLTQLFPCQNDLGRYTKENDILLNTIVEFISQHLQLSDCSFARLLFTALLFYPALQLQTATTEQPLSNEDRCYQMVGKLSDLVEIPYRDGDTHTWLIDDLLSLITASELDKSATEIANSLEQRVMEGLETQSLSV